MASIIENDKIELREIEQFRKKLLSWYDLEGRDLPWRIKGGGEPDPYKVWLSEIMLQQTTVAAVKPYFLKFLGHWPDIFALAAAKQEDVTALWAGLGYYSRARNLHACAKIIAEEFDGFFPQNHAVLRKLPGIGDYTAAAIMTIAFNKPDTVVDGNIERIMSRIFAVTDPLPGSKKHLKLLAHRFFSDYTERPGDFAQALMDLGAMICTPKSPKCLLCPVSSGCSALKTGSPGNFPFKEKKKPKPKRYGSVYWVETVCGSVLVQRRPEKGLLGGMLGLPGTKWSTGKEQEPWHLKEFEEQTFEKEGTISHVFTHFDLTLSLERVPASLYMRKAPDSYFWIPIATLVPEHFPSVYKKALKAFLSVDGAKKLKKKA